MMVVHAEVMRIGAVPPNMSPAQGLQHHGLRFSMQRRLMMQQDDMDAQLEAAEAAARAATEAAAEAAAERERQLETNAPAFDVRSLAGICAPLGFWDPAGFSEGCPETKMRFYREVEVKHSRVAMLAAVGFPLAEHWHPLWGGNVDVPSYVAFQATPLQTFWPVVIGALAVLEVCSVFTFERPYDLFYSGSGGFWNIRADHPPGDMQFDPLNLKPTDATARLEMETKELNHGRVRSDRLAVALICRLASLTLSRSISRFRAAVGHDWNCRHGGAGACDWRKAVVTLRGLF
jgi:light-harvesting complex I chlorophyll a/b binding protein 4